MQFDHWQLNTLSNSSTKSEQNLTNIFWEVCLQSKCDGYADAQMNGYTQTLLGPSIILQWTLKLKHLKIQKYLILNVLPLKQFCYQYLIPMVLPSTSYPYGITINTCLKPYTINQSTNTLSLRYCHQYLILLALPPIPYSFGIATNTLFLWYCHQYLIAMALPPIPYSYGIATNTLSLWHCYQYLILNVLPSITYPYS